MSKPLNLQTPDGEILLVSGNHFLSYGAGAPTASLVGYSVGAMYVDVTNANLYLNGGTETATVWKLVTRAA